MFSPAPRASRRAVLSGGTAAAAALVAASGCGFDQAADDAVAGAGDDPTAAAVDADSDLVETVGDHLRSALSLAVATAAADQRLRRLTGRLATVHRAHLRELGQPDDIEDRKVLGTAETARARLLNAEETLQRHLVTGALAAESGALAQVFASMAAAVAQERAVAS